MDYSASDDDLKSFIDSMYKEKCIETAESLVDFLRRLSPSAAALTINKLRNDGIVSQQLAEQLELCVEYPEAKIEVLL